MRKAAIGNQASKRDPRVLLQQGLALHRSGQLNEALTCYRQFLVKTPDHAEALHMLGVAEFQRQHFEEAADAIKRSIQLASHNPMAHFNYGNTCRALGRVDEALNAFGKAIELKSDYAEARMNRGLLAFEQGHWKVAAEELALLVQRQPSDMLLVKLGLALHQLGHFEQAAGCHAQAIQHAPNNPEAHCHLGSALMKLNRLQDALACYEHAITLAPGYATAYLNRAHALNATGDLEEAAEAYRRTLECDPTCHEARIQLGIVLGWLSQPDAAVAQFDAVIAQQPDHAAAHFNKGLTLLMDGQLETAWPEYEWRLADSTLSAAGIVHQIPRVVPDWDGQALDGYLLVLPEQGLGDQIFYAALLAEARQRTRHIVACVDPRLVVLFSRSLPDIEFLSPADLRHRLQDGENRFAAQIHAASLGHLLHIGPERVRNLQFPYLIADSERSAVLRQRLQAGLATGSLVCGLAWHSKNAQSGTKKSLDLAALAPVLATPGTRFVDLQYGDTRAERDSLAADTGIDLLRIDDVDNLHDIDGLAALIEACDLVITVSNSTAHLAAALGKPVWILLADGPGLFWFWHRRREDSPWYPSARLFRQPARGDWPGVIAKVGHALATRMAEQLR